MAKRRKKAAKKKAAPKRRKKASRKKASKKRRRQFIDFAHFNINGFFSRLKRSLKEIQKKAG